jgi:hypothetical protein
MRSQVTEVYQLLKTLDQDDADIPDYKGMLKAESLMKAEMDKFSALVVGSHTDVQFMEQYDDMMLACALFTSHYDSFYNLTGK